MLKSISIVLFTFLLSGIVLGQESNIPSEQSRGEGVFANLFHFTFLPGKSDEGLEVLKNVLLPAFEKAGVNVTLIEDLMGTKDVYMIIELDEGPRYYEPLVSKQDAKLWSSLLELTGSAEKAEEELDKFIKSLTKQSQTLVFIPKQGKM